MRSHASKNEGEKSNKAAGSADKAQQPNEATAQFVDSRPKTIAQLKLQRQISNSPRARQLQSFQDMANNSPKAQQAVQLQAMARQQAQQTLQLMGVEEEEEKAVQGKFEPVQRMSASEEEEEPVQGKFETVQRAKEEEEEPVQGRFETVQRAKEEEEEPMQGKFGTLQQKPQTNNTGLPGNLKTGVENLSGYSMDDVKVHYNSDKPAQLNAHAYAQGTDIHIAPGQEKHLPHEAWHVAQQKQGRVKPTTQMKGKVNINDDAGLEKEADVMGAKALSFTSTEVPQFKQAGTVSNSPYQLATAKVKGVLIGKTNIYDSKGNKVAKVAKDKVIEVNENDFVVIPGKTLVYLSSKDKNIIWNDPDRLLNNADDLWISMTRYTVEEEEAEEDDGVALSAGPLTFQNGKVTIPIWGDKEITVGRNGVSHSDSMPSKTFDAPLPSIDVSIDIPFGPGVYATAGLNIAPTLSVTISGGTYEVNVGQTNSIAIKDAGVSGSMGLAITASAGVGAGVANLVGLEAGMFGTLGGEASLSGTLGGTADFTADKHEVDLGLKASADIIGKVGAFVQAKFSILKARKEFSLAEKKFAHFDYQRKITLGTGKGSWMPEITDFSKTEYGDKTSSSKLKTVDGKTYQQLDD